MDSRRRRHPSPGPGRPAQDPAPTGRTLNGVPLEDPNPPSWYSSSGQSTPQQATPPSYPAQPAPGRLHPGHTGQPYPPQSYPYGLMQEPAPRKAWQVVVGIFSLMFGVLLGAASVGALAEAFVPAFEEGGAYLIGTYIGFGIFGVLTLLFIGGGLLLIVQPWRKSGQRPPRR